MKRKEILEKAIACVCQDRQATHGKPENTFQAIADLWSSYLYHRFGVEDALAPHDVAWMMTLFKTARAIANPTHEDNPIDAAGYAALAGELALEKNHGTN